MREHDLLSAVLESLDDETLAVLAERLRPHLTSQGKEHLLDPKEAGELLGLHERTVARMAREGRLPGAMKVGRGWRFKLDSLTPVPPTSPVRPPAPSAAHASGLRGASSVDAIRGAK